MARRANSGSFVSTTSPEEDAKIRDLYEGGLSVNVIAVRVNRSSHFVHVRLKKMGILRSRGESRRARLTYTEMNLVRLLYEREGLSAMEISKILGVHKSTVDYRLRAFGVPKRSMSEAQTVRLRRHRRKQLPRRDSRGRFLPPTC